MFDSVEALVAVVFSAGGTDISSSWMGETRLSNELSISPLADSSLRSRSRASFSLYSLRCLCEVPGLCAFCSSKIPGPPASLDRGNGLTGLNDPSPPVVAVAAMCGAFNAESTEKEGMEVELVSLDITSRAFGA